MRMDPSLSRLPLVLLRVLAILVLPGSPSAPRRETACSEAFPCLQTKKPGSGRSTRRDYEEDFSHESARVDRRAGTTGRRSSRFRAFPDDRAREKTRNRGRAWNRSSSFDSDSSQRKGRWHRHPPKHLPDLELYSGKEPWEDFYAQFCRHWTMVPPGSIDLP